MPEVFKAVITGASRGIGNAMARHLLTRGCKVVAVARGGQNLDQLGADYPGLAFPIACDLGDPTCRARLVDQIAAEHADLSMLINNAARQEEVDLFRDASAQDRMAAELALNLAAPMMLCTALLPLLVQRKRAHIVNVTTGLVFAPKATVPGYCATKAGLHSFTIALRYQCEAAMPQIQVSEAVLPMVDTDMTTGRGQNKLDPVTAGPAILDGAQAGRAMIWVGKTRFLPLLMRLSPALVARMLK